MKYFKDVNNQVWSFEDDVDDINSYPNTPKNLIPISEEEAKIILNPPKTPEQIEAEQKAEIKKQLSELTATSSKSNVFDANLEARQNMADAIIASSTLGSTTTTWRMADNSEVLITLDELKEAHALAIQEYARIKGIGV